MNASYRLGSWIVSLTVAVSAALCVAFVSPRPAQPVASAAEALQAQPLPLGTFQLKERSGRDITQADLADRVWLSAFIFTRCPSSCPRITAVMKGLQAKLADTGVQLVSISVDPEHDTPEVLTNYAKGFGADPDRWWFLTGPKESVYSLILDQFKVPVSESTEADRKAGAEEVSHSARIALVDRGNQVVGYFDANDPKAVARLAEKARSLDNVWGHRLPSINAALNGSCALLLLLGLALIRAGKVKPHIVCMSTALVVSALFLTSYLVYHFLVVKGSVPFQGVGRPVRILYFTVLLSHTVLAVAVVPLVAITLTHAIRKRFASHAKIARVTFPIWLYVSITGVVVYWMLYQMDFSAAAELVSSNV